VTGAGGGLGRCHAVELAKLGAKVVVNDLGGAMDGTGGSSEAAAIVVDEIKQAGGQAIANGGSVSDARGAKSMVEDAMKAWGRIDILINNAGILRDKSFTKMTMDDFRAVVEVHLMGSVLCTKEVWPIMRDKVTAHRDDDVAFGPRQLRQTNYGSAKLSLVGFMNSLKIEGAKNNVFTNAMPQWRQRADRSLMPARRSSVSGPNWCACGAVPVQRKAPNGVIMQSGGRYSSRAR
jgi:NAD(P)-dependent dehydrogenase (short-subunit alcohol dehydrogenase family)